MEDFHIARNAHNTSTVQFEKLVVAQLLLLPLALQPAVGFGLSNNILPFFLSVTNSLHHR
jgi:hypothetical protein